MTRWTPELAARAREIIADLRHPTDGLGVMIRATGRRDLKAEGPDLLEAAMAEIERLQAHIKTRCKCGTTDWWCDEFS